MSLKDIDFEPYSTRNAAIDKLFWRQGKQPRFSSDNHPVARPLVDGVDFARRRIVLLPFALILGICIYTQLSVEPPYWLYGLLCLALFGGAVLTRRNIVLRNCLFLAGAVAFGIALMAASAVMRGTPLLAYPSAGVINGEIRQVELRPDGNLRAVVDLGSMRPGALDDVRFVRLTIAQKHFEPARQPAIGDQLEVRARFIPVPKPVYPGGYDPQFHGFFDGIGAYGSTLDPVVLSDGQQTAWSLVQNFIFDVRQGVAQRFSSGMKPQDAAIARALIIGDQSAIEPELRDEIAVSGLAHLLAISGLHLSLVAGGAFLGIRFVLALPLFPPQMPAKSIAAVAAMGAAAFYLGISGANIATQRATIMLIVAFVAVLTGRRAITLRNVALVCIAMILLYPNEVFKPGFQLSFAAVGALVGVYEWSKGQAHSRKWPKWAQFLGGLSLTSLVAGIATAPIAAVHFSQFAPFGLFANLIAVPLVGFFILPALIFACVLMPFGLELPVLALAGLGIDYVIIIARFFTNLGGDWTYVAPLAGWVLPLCGVALMMFLIAKSAWRFVPPLVAGMVISLFGTAATPDILVSGQTRSAFVKTDKGQWAQIDRIGNNFTTRVWAEWLGVDLAQQELAGNCDEQGCVVHMPEGQTVLFARQRAAVIEDCGLVDLIIEQDYLYQKCSTGSHLVRNWDVRRLGNAALYFGDDGHIQIKHSVTDAHRPWRVKH
ncbi:hypothetical protein MXMO3_02073 [Maritalea myrionectae]|uniref:ComEC/Rec2-related protein domain-containing protein n=1 Tax=Maritalea myrionectae TaxID=454601 RepID=A0A2R4MFB6_9HYPH|nr:ComEC/Rec2 family competence protein [Maritalea myrionectae]AVX04594.1 hypothetical protein MXMO3_02073 [Maritalea myrionectae]